MKSSNLSIDTPERRFGHYKDQAIKELELMHEAIEAQEHKEAKHHKIVADIAIDEMTITSRLIEQSDGRANKEPAKQL